MKKITYVENLRYIIFPRELYRIKKKLQDSSDNSNDTVEAYRYAENLNEIEKIAYVRT